ncbi:LysR substrate-binding domain-containing protein [Streptomyces olivoreticuli]
MRAGDLDAALLRGERTAPGLEFLPLWQDALMAALPAGHELAARETVALARLTELPLRLSPPSLPQPRTPRPGDALLLGSRLHARPGPGVHQRPGHPRRHRLRQTVLDGLLRPARRSAPRSRRGVPPPERPGARHADLPCGSEWSAPGRAACSDRSLLRGSRRGPGVRPGSPLARDVRRRPLT